MRNLEDSDNPELDALSYEVLERYSWREDRRYTSSTGRLGKAVQA